MGRLRVLLQVSGYTWIITLVIIRSKGNGKTTDTPVQPVTGTLHRVCGQLSWTTPLNKNGRNYQKVYPSTGQWNFRRTVGIWSAENNQLSLDKYPVSDGYTGHFEESTETSTDTPFSVGEPCRKNVRGLSYKGLFSKGLLLPGKTRDGRIVS